jgi:hypothetical protein
MVYIGVEKEQKLIELYKSGVLLKNICAELKIGKQTVHNYAKKYSLRRQRLHAPDNTSFATFTQESCYWAGFIAADGCMNNVLTSIRIDLSAKDKKHLFKILSFVKDKSPYIVEDEKWVKITGKWYFIKHCYVDINSTKIVQNLKKNFSITPAKSWTIMPPKSIPESMIRHYVRGYFDGDGCICWHKAHKSPVFQISCGSKKLLDWIGEKIREQVAHEFTKRALLPMKGKKIYRIVSIASNAKPIFDWLYSNSTPETRLERKFNRYIKICKITED